MKKLFSLTISLLMTIVMVAALVPASDAFAANNDGDSSAVRVGITYHNQTITAALENSGAEVVLLPTVKTKTEARQQLSDISAIVFPGGRPVDPQRYSEKNLYSKRINKVRDRSETCYIKVAIKKDMPVLGICRGHQLLNVVSGGTLYQNISKQFEPKNGKHVNHRREHTIKVYADTIIGGMIGEGTHRVNSRHGQAVKDLGENLIVSARSKDGSVEVIEMTNRTFVVGIQFHPEDLTSQAKFQKIFDTLVKYGTKYKKKQ